MNQPPPFYTIVATNFSSPELQDLCGLLRVDYDDLPGSTKTLKALNLQNYLSNRGRIVDLLNQVKFLRSNLDLRPYLYLVISDRFYNEDAIIDLLASFDISVKDFGGQDKYSWGS